MMQVIIHETPKNLIIEFPVACWFLLSTTHASPLDGGGKVGVFILSSPSEEPEKPTLTPDDSYLIEEGSQ